MTLPHQKILKRYFKFMCETSRVEAKSIQKLNNEFQCTSQNKAFMTP